MAHLKLCSYNVHGVNDSKWPFLTRLTGDHDIVLIQEHWLRDCEFHKFGDHLHDVSYSCVSPMKDGIFFGRPYGGCSILWKSSLKSKISPVDSPCNRFCAIRLEIECASFLVCSVYMPCDTAGDDSNQYVFDEVLNAISSTASQCNVDYIICGGDFNTDLSRSGSLHTRALTKFVNEQGLSILDGSYDFSFHVDYTFESSANHSRSCIDHFVVSQNLLSCIVDVHTNDSVDNLSDHLPLSCMLNVDVDYVNAVRVMQSTPKWDEANEGHFAAYKIELDAQLSAIDIPMEAIRCTDPLCNDQLHRDALDAYHNGIVGACLHAAQSAIPMSMTGTNGRRKAHIPGWNDYIRPLKEDALFWHFIWKENGRPQAGIIADIRRRTRSRYHCMLRRLKKNESLLQSTKMAENFVANNRKEFWTEVNKLKGGASKTPACIDGAHGGDCIAQVFGRKYEQLFNHVSYDDDEMDVLLTRIEEKVMQHSLHDGCTHNILVSDVIAMSKQLKQGKHDGNEGLYSNHITRASHRFHCSVALLFNSLLLHASVPSAFALCTVIPIPKNKRKSLNDSDNYRAIALSSILGKLLDKIILYKGQTVFQSSDYQFGYKQSHSTMHCSFVVNEVIQFFHNNGSDVYIALLDATKAFDCVKYTKLFVLLLNKKICPLVARFLLKLYLQQKLRIKWNDSYSGTFNVSNGVKQGGVLSPLLFTVYMDVLLTRLKESNVGCHIDRKYLGSFAYADDIILLSPSVTGLKAQLKLCSEYASEYSIKFNASKTKLIVCRRDNIDVAETIVKFQDKYIEVVQQDVHLGCLVGNVDKRARIDAGIKDFLSKTTMLKCHFKLLPVDVMYSLFKTHCMPLYSSVLWDLSDRSIELFYTAWRKSIRSVLGLPYCTHGVLLNLVCDDVTIYCQLHCRFLSFLQSLVNSRNSVIQLCAALSLKGSGSNVSNNVSSLCYKLRCSREEFIHVSRYASLFRRFVASEGFDDEHVRLASLVRDLLDMRVDCAIDVNGPMISQEEIGFALNILCTE